METTATDRPRQHLVYPEATMFELVARAAQQYPNEPAYEFYNKKTSYAQFIRRIERAARAFWAFGVRPGDAVTLCLPNIPQALDCFYAVNRMGAIANIVHPLSAQNEIVYYLNVSESRVIVTVDLFYEKVAAALKDVDHPVTILTCRMQEELPLHLAALYLLKKGKDYLQFPQAPHLLWSEFLKKGDADVSLPAPSFEKYRTAAILYSGGTTGVPKGICLTDLNFNACAMQAREAIQEEFRSGLKMLSCMPLFHGFGLGINIHTVLIHGACCILTSNLGSIQCPAVHHHLSNYGTNSSMITIGALHKEEVLMPDGTKEIRDVVDIGATLDERIADGVYFAKSLKLIKHIFAHPEMLEKPIGENSGFEY